MHAALQCIHHCSQVFLADEEVDDIPVVGLDCWLGVFGLAAAPPEHARCPGTDAVGETAFGGGPGAHRVAVTDSDCVCELELEFCDDMGRANDLICCCCVVLLGVWFQFPLGSVSRLKTYALYNWHTSTPRKSPTFLHLSFFGSICDSSSAVQFHHSSARALF